MNAYMRGIQKITTADSKGSQQFRVPKYYFLGTFVEKITVFFYIKTFRCMGSD